MEVYVTVRHAGITYYPRDPYEHFPYAAIVEGQRLRGNDPIGSEAGWAANPHAPASDAFRGERAVAFVCEGPDAGRAAGIIVETLREPPEGAFLGIGETFSEMLRHSAAPRREKWRPAGYSPAGVLFSSPPPARRTRTAIAERMRAEMERRGMLKEWERMGGA